MDERDEARGQLADARLLLVPDADDDESLTLGRAAAALAAGFFG